MDPANIADMSINGIPDSTESQHEEGKIGTNGMARVKKLCETCQELDLSVDKFVIYDGTFKAPKNASGKRFPGDRRYQSDFSLKSGNQPFLVGGITDILARSQTCLFCSLVVKSVENHVHESTTVSPLDHDFAVDAILEGLRQTDSLCFVNWEIDGRDNDRTSGRKARTRRLHLHWNNTKVPDSYLVFVAPQRLFDFNSDSQGSWERAAFFLGRELKTDGNNQVLMKSWLDQCHHYHSEACSGDQSNEFVEMATQSYFGVIDVLDMCLKSLPCRTSKSPEEDPSGRYPPPVLRYAPPGPSESTALYEPYAALYEPYVALSYVWGLQKNYTTKTSNIRVHQQQGSLETSLGEIPRVIRDAMELVRRLGLRYLWVDSLCIVQDSKRSWTLNSQVMNLIYGNAFLTICAADGKDSWCGLTALDSSGRSASQHIEECAPGVRLMVSQLAETGINSSVWNTRAWTFQERLLSKRCLIFTEGRVFFQCRTATMSEDLVSESHGAGWSLDLAKALPQILHELKRRPIRVYMNCMSHYSERKLTQPKDILAAFIGVCNLISDVMRAPFIFGMPSSHFDLALLWEPLQSVSRRVQQPGEDFQDMVFPSWSWCGWKGGPMAYRTCQIEGALTNVHEWLTEHTWIAWYIRDGRGNLRPIWDGEKSEECDSVEERWKGYRAAFPDPEFTDLQTKALKTLGNPNEDDFIKWAKEQEQAEREMRQLELAKKPMRHAYYDNDDYGVNPRQRDMRHVFDRMGVEEHRRERKKSLSPGRRREKNMEFYREVDPPAEEVEDQDKPRTFRDEYGRNIPSDIARRVRGGFQQCLPDNPFRVYIEKYTAQPDKDFPDQPLLQFWTWWAALRIVQSSKQTTDLPGLKKYDIADGVGDWCGSIILDTNWLASEEKKGYKVDGSRRDFLAISDAKAFTKEECDVWTYYVPMERENSEWDLYYVLLVEPDKDRIWHRVALGKVFKAAFENAELRRWREIILG